MSPKGAESTAVRRPVGSPRARVAWILVGLGLAWQAALGAERGSEAFGRRWSWFAPWSSYQGDSISLGDYDGDGFDDALVPGCSGGCWIVYSRAAVGYRQIETSLPTGPIDWLGFGPAASDRAVVLALRSGLLEITSAADPSAVRTIAFQSEQTDLVIDDLDADGDLELVVVDPLDLSIYDYATGEHLTTKYGFGGVDLDVGALDADSAREIAVVTGLGACWVVDGATLAVDWGVPSGFGRQVRFGDLVPGGGDELASEWYSSYYEGLVRVWAPPATQPLYETGNFSGEQVALRIADVATDAGEEILVGATGPVGGIRVFRGDDGQLIRSIVAPTAHLGFEVGDVDRSVGREIVTSESRLFVYDLASGSLEYASPPWGLQFRAGTGVDVDGDGDGELVVGGWSDYRLADPLTNAFVFSGLGGGEPVPNLLSTTRWCCGAVYRLDARDLDGDGAPDLCATFSVGYSFVECKVGLGPAVLWSEQVNPSADGLLIADIDGDSDVEVVVETYWSYDENGVTSYDAATGLLEWASPNLAPEVIQSDELCSGNFDQDGDLELLAASSLYGGVALLSPVDGSVITSFDLQDLYAATCIDLDGDGRLELIGGASDGSIRRVDLEAGIWGELVVSPPEPATALAVGDLLGTSEPEIAVSSASGLRILDLGTSEELWFVPGQFDFSWYTGSLQTLDVDGDGRSELVAGASSGVAVFGLPYAGEVLFVDGFELGDLAQWSRASVF